MNSGIIAGKRILNDFHGEIKLVSYNFVQQLIYGFFRIFGLGRI